MKKLNKSRQALLQKKRTKRNQARKGVKYDPNKRLALAPATTLQEGTAPSNAISGSTTLVL